MPANSRPDSNGANDSDNIMGSPPSKLSLRERTDSESSDKIARFVLPSVDGSPPKVLTLDEVSHVFKNIKNMELVHEIALNPDFKLQPYEPPENSLERRVRDCMHKVFWDVLREQLQRNPPCFDHAIQLLGDIKDCFSQIISQSSKRTLDYINEVLDTTVIRQQAEQGVLDFKEYANFVIQTMAKCCAPVRDEDVRNLSQIEDVVDTFKGILEIMQLMKLDMANFLLDFARNNVMANSVEYEKTKFKEYLEYYKFGFPATEDWLKQNISYDSNNKPSTVDQTITKAYIALMDWPDNKEFPEILMTDKERIIKLSYRAKRLCVAACLISICSAIPTISQRVDNRMELAKQFEILLQDVCTESDVANSMENIWLQIKTSINCFLENENQTKMDENSETLLKAQIMQAANKEGAIRSLMWKRLQTYFRMLLCSGAGEPPPPPGYVEYQTELESYANALKRVIVYNNSVFGDYFRQILTKESSPSNSNETEKPTSSVAITNETEKATTSALQSQ